MSQEIARKFWNDLYKQIGPIISSNMIGVFDDVIIKRYNEPHRKYHNLNHIIYCLNLFEEVKERLRVRSTHFTKGYFKAHAHS